MATQAHSFDRVEEAPGGGVAITFGWTHFSGTPIVITVSDEDSKRLSDALFTREERRRQQREGGES